MYTNLNHNLESNDFNQIESERFNFCDYENDKSLHKLLNEEENIAFIDHIIRQKIGRTKLSEQSLMDYSLKFCKSHPIEDVLKLVFFYEAISAIGEKIVSLLDIDEIFMKTNKELSKLMEIDFLGISVYYKEKREFIFRTIKNGVYEIAPPKKTKDTSAFSSYCINNNKPIIIHNILNEYSKYINKINTEGRGVTMPLSSIFFPLTVNGEIIGVMSVQSIKENAFTEADLNMLRVLGRYVGIAIKNSLEYEKIEKKSIYDSMTGLLTKEAILKEGNALQTTFAKTEKGFCILMIDMDNFKSVNDKFGHVIGDNVIKLVTHTISKQIRSTDYAGRYGGDEFLVICPKINKLNAFNLAERIRSAVENINYTVNDTKLSITVSIGLYEFKNQNVSFIEGINEADSYLYKAKNISKNIVIAN